MKEAAGEANMTVITIVLIGVVSAVGLLLVPRLLNNTSEKACCTEAAGKWSGGKCNDAGNGLYNASEYTSCVNSTKNK